MHFSWKGENDIEKEYNYFLNYNNYYFYIFYKIWHFYNILMIYVA